jgi:hypothetical protein
MLASAFAAVNITAYLPLGEAGGRLRSDSSDYPGNTGVNGKLPSPSMSMLPEEGTDSLRSIRTNQRLKNSKNILTNRTGNGTGFLALAAGKARISYWPVFRLALYPDMLQSVRDIIISFLHNKDGMK